MRAKVSKALAAKSSVTLARHSHLFTDHVPSFGTLPRPALIVASLINPLPECRFVCLRELGQRFGLDGHDLMLSLFPLTFNNYLDIAKSRCYDSAWLKESHHKIK